MPAGRRSGAFSGDLNLVRRKSVNLAQVELVTKEPLSSQTKLPIAIRPAQKDLDLAIWLKFNHGTVESLLWEHGGVLFRGFSVNSQAAFARVVESSGFELMNYQEGATPRTDLGGKIYTSTNFPSEHSIALHNELSYVMTFPMKICFCCLKAAERGGETPIADTRRVLDRIDLSVRDIFAAKGWMLVRNFGTGFSLPWQSTFRTNVRSEVEDYCRQARIECEWLDGDRLRTRQVRPAIALHPKTKQPTWFNHVAFWHVLSLDFDTRTLFLQEFGEDGLPYNTYYGDGKPIEEWVIRHLRAVYDLETVTFPWQEGDVLLLDNMLCAHGRKSYIGHRSVIVSMGEPLRRSDC